MKILKEANYNNDVKEEIVDYIDSLDDAVKVDLHNEYCMDTNNADDEIYDNDNFEEVLDPMVESQGSWWLACRVYYGNYVPQCDYFKFNAYGNLISIDSYDLGKYIYSNEIADYIIKNDKDFGYSEIRDILNNAESEDEE